MPNTKIVATLGPATDDPGTLRELMRAGVDVVRLNTSHGAWAEHAARIRMTRASASQEGRNIGVLLDLQGPKIRLEKFASGGCALQNGAGFTITSEPVLGDSQRASTSYQDLAHDVKPGDRVLLADGAVELRALAAHNGSVDFEVVSGGHIGDNQGINLPGVQVSAPSLTPKDLQDLEAGLGAGIDMVALSFVRTAGDVLQLRERIGDRTPGIAVVAKIEKPQGYDSILSILEVADGVMVARGDLGVEVALEKVPPMQKSIIRRARRKGRFVITATQMLESMIEHPTPTRAEVSDVANAIYDGTDAVMLSAETSVGAYPVQAVSYMARIATEAERSIKAKGFADPPHHLNPTSAEILADAAYHAARSWKVAAIVVFTSSGSSARLISRYRPPVCIYAITPNESVARHLSMNYGVFPILAPEVSSTDEMLMQMDHLMLQNHLLNTGDTVVFVAGQPIGRPGTTNLMKLHKIGDAG